MALKKIDVGVKFPKLKPSRLGAAPPLDDVLDNVGAPEAPPSRQNAAPPSPSVRSVQNSASASVPAKGRGVHAGVVTDARRGPRTGRTYQFGARTTPEFAEEVKRMAAEKGVTIGELLEDMLAAHRKSASR